MKKNLKKKDKFLYWTNSHKLLLGQALTSPGHYKIDINGDIGIGTAVCCWPAMLSYMQKDGREAENMKGRQEGRKDHYKCITITEKTRVYLSSYNGRWPPKLRPPGRPGPK